MILTSVTPNFLKEIHNRMHLQKFVSPIRQGIFTSRFCQINTVIITTYLEQKGMPKKTMHLSKRRSIKSVFVEEKIKNKKRHILFVSFYQFLHFVQIDSV